MRYRGGGLGSAPSPVWREDEWRQTHTENTRKHTHARAPSPTYNQDTTLPEQSDRPSGIVCDNTGWEGTWGAGCPQCDSTQGQDASAGFFRCARQSKERPDSDICQVSVRRFTYWCPTLYWRRFCHSLTKNPSVSGLALERPRRFILRCCQLL